MYSVTKTLNQKACMIWEWMDFIVCYPKGNYGLVCAYGFKNHQYFFFSNDNQCSMYWYVIVLYHLDLLYHHHCKKLIEIHSVTIVNDDSDKYVKMNGFLQFWLALKVWNIINCCKKPTCCNLSHRCILLDLWFNKFHFCEVYKSPQILYWALPTPCTILTVGLVKNHPIQLAIANHPNITNFESISEMVSIYKVKKIFSLKWSPELSHLCEQFNLKWLASFEHIVLTLCSTCLLNVHSWLLKFTISNINV